MFPVTSRVLRLVALAVLAVPLESVSAQRHLSLEVTPLHGTLGYGVRTSASTIRGGEIGFGFPQLDRTLSPSDEDLIDFLHLGLFQRTQVGQRGAIDTRIQLGLGELNGCSGCLPGILAALSVGGFVGTPRVKLGARLTAGVIKESQARRSVVLSLRPLAVLLQW